MKRVDVQVYFSFADWGTDNTAMTIQIDERTKVIKDMVRRDIMSSLGTVRDILDRIELPTMSGIQNDEHYTEFFSL